MKLKLVFSGLLLFVLSAVAWGANNGGALYKKKCAGCHGPTGEGKGKAPALKGTQMDTSQIVDKLTKGKPDGKAPHNKGMAGLTAAQAQAIAEYIKSLQ
jgi:mono/diheme cytochrome c family protein